MIFNSCCGFFCFVVQLVVVFVVMGVVFEGICQVLVIFVYNVYCNIEDVQYIVIFMQEN